MNEHFTLTKPLPDIPLWKNLEEKRVPVSFELELTARCNNNCRHCYINLPAFDRNAKLKELSTLEIEDLAHQAVDLGALWCLITGGEPLLRKDFPEIYLILKKQGLLVSVFTNACLVTPEHVRLFQHFPPRTLEVTIYGITADTYEKVTRKPGSFKAFRHGLDLLLAGGIKVRLKSMALRSNFHEIFAIGQFCREHTDDHYRFDPLLHLRYDGDLKRNEEIISERLTAEEIVCLEQNDEERKLSLQKKCSSMLEKGHNEDGCDHIFHCGAGQSNFAIGYDGTFRLCPSLVVPGCTIDLRQHSLAEAWYQFAPQVRDLRSSNKQFQQSCRTCSLIDLCLWCPATGYFECGAMDKHSDYFCQVAHARANALIKPEANQF